MKKIIFISLMMGLVSVKAADVWISVTPVTAVASNATCQFAYTGLANYTKSAASGWGWKQDTNTIPPRTVTDTNRSDTKIQWLGKNGATGCGFSPVTVTPYTNVAFRFTVYFPNNPPTNAPYWIKLSGFLP